jgi:hypothetical protein
MAKGDLHRILMDIEGELNKSTTSLRAEMEAWVHVMDVSASDVAKQVFIQLRDIELKQLGQMGLVKTYGANVKSETTREDATGALEAISQGATFSEEAKADIKTVCDNYARSVYDLLVANAGSTFNVRKIRGNDTEYTVQITPLGPAGTNVYKFLTKGKVLEIAKTKLKRELNLLYSKHLKKVLKKRQIDVRGEVFFHLGHITAVSEVQAAKAVSSLRDAVTNVEKKWEVAGLAESLLNYEMLSKFSNLGNPEFTKEFDAQVAYVRPESEASNLTQSGYEKEVLNKVRAAFKKIIEGNKDWASQGGSDSVVDAIGKSLLAKAAKHGAKVNSKTQIDSTPNKVTAQSKIKSQVRKVRTSIGSIGAEDYAETGNVTQSGVSLNRMLPMLNERLPEYVRANMGRNGRLVNRTGRFAESTEIVDLGDGSTITYSYMKSPYQVFEGDRTRDPRPLIEESIRELAAGIIRTKFNLRRV